MRVESVKSNWQCDVISRRNVQVKTFCKRYKDMFGRSGKVESEGKVQCLGLDGFWFARVWLQCNCPSCPSDLKYCHGYSAANNCPIVVTGPEPTNLSSSILTSFFFFFFNYQKWEFSITISRRLRDIGFMVNFGTPYQMGRINAETAWQVSPWLLTSTFLGHSWGSSQASQFRCLLWGTARYGFLLHTCHHSMSVVRMYSSSH